jgi:uroporphyrinogen decarboxylase
VIDHPVRSIADVNAIKPLDPQQVAPVAQAITQLVGELGDVPLIGFAGAPFTLASYLVEGGKSSNYARTKGLMYREPDVWNALMGKLAEVVRRYLRAQIEAGAQAVQLFDSWVGDLAPVDYVAYVQPHVRHILEDVEKTGVPVIHFGTNTAMLLELQRDAGGTVIGVDFRTPLNVAREKLGSDVALQGNLDPLVLCAPRELIVERVEDVLRRAGDGTGHIFNLGHGIVPGTPPDSVKFVTDLVHERTAR